jgi:hypothetical protein
MIIAILIANLKRFFGRGITIDRIIKTRKGKWVFREKINIPYTKFSEFCKIINDVNDMLPKRRKKGSKD